MNPLDSQTIDITGIAVALGRIEEKVSHLTAMDDRLRSVENDLTELKARQAPKTPWYVITGGIAGIGSIIVTTVAVLTILINGLPA